MPTLEEAVAVYVKLDLAPTTIHYYQSRLSEMVSYFGADRLLDSISYADIVGYVYAFRQRLKETTYYQYQIVVKTFFKWCTEVGFIPISPAARLKIHRPNRQPVERAIPDTTLDLMYEHLRITHRIRDLAILCFIDESACRRGGVASLRISQLHLDEMTAIVKEKGRRFEIVDFGPDTVEALEHWLAIRPKTDHDYVFTAHRPSQGFPPLQPEAISEMIARLSKSVVGRGYRPHSIRHFALEDLVRSGEPVTVVSDKANHLHRRTTQDYYFPPKDRTAVHQATLKRAARRRRTAETSTKIIPLYDADQDSG